MKSSDNTLLLVGLFVLIVVVIALIVYYTRPGETKTSEQTSDTTKLAVENLSFQRTLNPDPSVGEGVSGYTIEPYGVEYAEGGKADYTSLSNNVTFTMIWNNAPGFNNVVNGFKIEHYVGTTKKHTFNYNSVITTETTNNTKEETISFSDFGKCKVKLSSADWTTKGDVIGQNKFKLFAIRKDNTGDALLYDGTIAESDGTFPTQLKIDKSQLSVTLSMTTPETVEFRPEVIEGGAATRAVISKTAYDISNEYTSLVRNGLGIYLETVKNKGGKEYYFQYEDGQYFLNDLTKGNPTTANPKLKVEIVNKGTDKSKGQIKKVGVSKYLSSPKNQNQTLGLYETNDSRLTEEIFTGFLWTFNERTSKSLKPIGGWTTTVGNTTTAHRNQINAKYGEVVCISGDDAFVGQPGYHDQGDNETQGGRVHIYKRTNKGFWELKKVITSSIVGTDPATGNEFGCSIAISGDYAVIGEKKFNQGNSKQVGRVYVIRKGDDGEWVTNKDATKRKPVAFTGIGMGTSVNELTSNYQGAHFGASVAISGNFITVGAPGSSVADETSQYDYGKERKGDVYLYKIKKREGDIKIEGRGKVTGRKNGERFGHAVDVSGNRVIVGAPYKSDAKPDTDRGDDWDGACSQNNGNRAWCPADGYPKLGSKTGSVSIYKMVRDSVTGKEALVLEREMNPNKHSWNPTDGLRFGESVAIDGMIAVIGAPGMKGAKKDTAEKQWTPKNGVVDNERTNTGGIFVLKGNEGNRKIGQSTTFPSWSLMFSECVYDGPGVNPYNINRVKNTPAIPNPQKDGEFGSSVSISDGKICVGQKGGTGEVLVYKHKLVKTDTYFYGRTGSKVGEPPKESRIKLEFIKAIKSPNPTSNGAFGSSVSISGGYTMIGAPKETMAFSGNASTMGGAYIKVV